MTNPYFARDDCHDLTRVGPRSPGPLYAMPVDGGVVFHADPDGEGDAWIRADEQTVVQVGDRS